MSDVRTKPRWIFFDLGWTLVDETAAHLARFHRLRVHRPHYAAVSDDEFVLLCEARATEFAPSPFLAMLRRLDPANWESAAEVAEYDHTQEKLYPGVAGVLEHLRRYFRLGVIANQSSGTAARLKRFGIFDVFSAVVASAEVGLCKPDPRIFTYAQDLADCPPGNATMVGDRLDNDIGPARAAGWRTVRILQGFSRHQQPRDEGERPHHTISSVTELPSCLN